MLRKVGPSFKWMSIMHSYMGTYVYMLLLPGFHSKGDFRSATHQSPLVCKLLNYLHGLKKASRKWFAKLSAAILGLDFKQSKSDYSMFTLNQGSLYVELLVSEDDILLTGNIENFINHLKQLLDAKFKLKDLGSVKYFLGIEVASTHGILLNQRK